jgi:uncharacterized protein with PQ loop repeat
MAPEFIIKSVGVAAGICSMVSFAPRKDPQDEIGGGRVTEDVFSGTPSAFVLWTIYGVLLAYWPIAASNFVCLRMAITVVALRLKYGDG